MWSTIIVFNQPGIEIGLQLVDRVIDLLAECDPVKLIQHSAMEALADSIRLWALGLGATGLQADASRPPDKSETGLVSSLSGGLDASACKPVAVLRRRGPRRSVGRPLRGLSRPTISQ